MIFLTQEDAEEPVAEEEVPPPISVEEGEPEGLIKENGEINWDCPCLQGMADGPCGDAFKESFSCFHYSEAEPKGIDCLEQFKSMQECFQSHPEVYGGLTEEAEGTPVTDEATAKVVEPEIIVEEVKNTKDTSESISQLPSDNVDISSEAEESAKAVSNEEELVDR